MNIKKLSDYILHKKNVVCVIGYDIGSDGSIEKYKEYKFIKENLILVSHYKNKKLIKTNKLKLAYNSDRSICNYIRDDGQKYTRYINTNTN